jgi:hypothetical protein
MVAHKKTSPLKIREVFKKGLLVTRSLSFVISPRLHQQIAFRVILRIILLHRQMQYVMPKN